MLIGISIACIQEAIQYVVYTYCTKTGEESMVSDVFQDESKNALSMSEIYTILRQDILTLKITPGALLSENQVSTRFNTSRTPIRNVFAHLAREGLVTVHPKKGTYVSLIDLDLASQIIFMRTQVEYAVMSHIASNPDAQLFKALEENLQMQQEQIRQGVNDEEFYFIDSQFHGLCMRSMRKTKLWEMIQRMDVHYSRYRRLDYKAARQKHVFETLLKEHKQLYQYMKNGEPAKLKYALTAHLYGGFFRINTRFETEYPELLTKNGKSVEDLLLEIKVLLNEAQKG